MLDTVDILIRKVPKDIADALSDLARSEGEDRQDWLRDKLMAMATAPIVRTRYILKAFGPGPTFVIIRRVDNEMNDPREGQTNLSEPQKIAYFEALEFVKRNRAGDRESAISALRREFETVFETVM